MNIRDKIELIGYRPLTIVSVIRAPEAGFTYQGIGILEIDNELARLWIEEHCSPDFLLANESTILDLSALFWRAPRATTFISPIGPIADWHEGNRLNGYINKYATNFGLPPSGSPVMPVRAFPKNALPANAVILIREDDSIIVTEARKVNYTVYQQQVRIAELVRENERLASGYVDALRKLQECVEK